MGGCDAFYGVFWVLPNAPLPVMGDLDADSDEPLPEPVLHKRTELRRVLSSLDLADKEQIQDASGCCDQYVRLLRAARTVDEPEGRSAWTSALTYETAEIPLAFDEPMALVLQAALLLTLGTGLAHARTLDCITEAAHCFCQAAGLVEYIISLQEDICASLQVDVPVELPDLSPRILNALAEMAVAMAQQLAIVKATLFSPMETRYSPSVLQNLHTGCQDACESFETAVIRSCYSARPKRHGCATLLGFATIFARLHRAQALQLTGELAFAETNVGKAIAFARAAARQLQERTSMRDVGLPPLEGHDGLLYQQHDRLASRIQAKRLALEACIDDWAKDNDSIYFEIVPSDESVLETDLSRAVIKKAVVHSANTRLGRVDTGMFRETVADGCAADLVTRLDGTQTEEDGDQGDREPDRDDDGDEDEFGDDSEASAVAQTHNPASARPVRDTDSEDDDHALQQRGSHEAQESERERASAPDVYTSANLLTATQLPPALHSARLTRRMATRVQPQRAMTSRTLLGTIGKLNSLLILQQSEEQLRKAVTDEAVFDMRRALLGGVDIYRLVKETHL